MSLFKISKNKTASATSTPAQTPRSSLQINGLEIDRASTTTPADVERLVKKTTTIGHNQALSLARMYGKCPGIWRSTVKQSALRDHSNMINGNQEEASGNPYLTISSVFQSGVKRVNESSLSQFERSAKMVQPSALFNQERAISTAVKQERVTVSCPQDYEIAFTQSLIGHDKVFLAVPGVSEQSWLSIFPHNITAPSLSTTLPVPGGYLESISQLAYYSSLLRKCLSVSSVAEGVNEYLGLLQQDSSSGSTTLHDEQELSRVRLLSNRVIETFLASDTTSSATIAEVVILGPSLNQEYYRKLLNSLIAKFENATRLDIDLLQGLVQLVQCAELDYLLPLDFVRILATLRVHLQDIHQQSVCHTYYLILALSTLFDVMAEGKVRDPRHAMDRETLLALLEGLSKSSDLYLKYQAAYALQGLLHIPSDEACRQFVLRHAGNVAMGLLGVASVCQLDVNGVSVRAERIWNASVDALDVGSNEIGDSQVILDSSEEHSASTKGGVLSGGRLVWYTALREAQEHIQNGRLADFARLVFEAPCHQNVEFQWGVCRLLGDIATDPRWEMAVRQHAIDFLAELHRHGSICGLDEEIGRWILKILCQVEVSPDPAVSGHVQRVLLGLQMEGIAGQQTVQRDIIASRLKPFPLVVRLPIPSSSELLARVQAAPDVECDLHRLKILRLGVRENALYIPLQAKPTLHASDDTLFPLMEKALEFLSSSRQVLLLLGDSGAGKSTFNLELERTLWKGYKEYGSIPLHISLPTIHNPSQDLIEKQLQRLRFSDAQIQELRQNRQFIVICDGYDESQLKTNLYMTNYFNQPGQWKAKVVISCRSQYLSFDYRPRFRPQSTSHYERTKSDLLQEAAISPFSRSQIKQYIEQYVSRLPANHLFQEDRPLWTKEDYVDKLARIPNLIDLVSNPFLLSLALEALPEVTAGFEKDLSLISITRVELFDGFVKQWLEVNQARLESSTLNDAERSEFDLLVEDDFAGHSLRFQKSLAEAIFREQAGNPVVQYIHLRDRDTWKAEFFSPAGQTKLLRESSAVTRSVSDYRFIHRSLLEYFYSRTIYDPLDYEGDDVAVYDQRRPICTLQAVLGQRSIISELSVIQFLVERVQRDPSFQRQLVDIVEQSKINVQAQASQAAANAITILIKAGTRFNGADLSGIRIAGADLCGGEFDSAHLEDADLSRTNLSKTWLRRANLRKANMAGARFGEFPYLKLDDEVYRCVFSSDGMLLAVSFKVFRISIYETTTWTNLANHSGGQAIAISPVTRELAKSRPNNTVELGDILIGGVRIALAGHRGPL
ncbi:WD repeat-containing protein 38 [Linnemannia gamsii]|uniref:WD repeat-containing protein 38 n=1 Tax=Linnemannia gamsii TaxID=64522 RepID=A0A9P6UHY4_9FUNG|nr:WD repeat-containing protein 38 [Linnemannia gamsii]